MLTLQILIKSTVLFTVFDMIHYFLKFTLYFNWFVSVNDRRPGLYKFQKIEKQFLKHLVLSRHHRKLLNYGDGDDLSFVISHDLSFNTQNDEYFQYSGHSNKASQAERDYLKWSSNKILTLLTVLPGLRNFPPIHPLLRMKIMERLRRMIIMRINWSRNWIPSAGEVFLKPRPLRRETFCLESVVFMRGRKIRGTKFFMMKSQVRTIRQMTVWSKNSQGCPLYPVGMVTDNISVKYIK